MTNQDLNSYEDEIRQIESEMEWRDPELEAYWFTEAHHRLSIIITLLEDNLYKLKRAKLSVVK